MVPLLDYADFPKENLANAPRVHQDCDLDRLIDVSTKTEHPIIIQDQYGKDVGLIDKATLLKGIQGGKA